MKNESSKAEAPKVDKDALLLKLDTRLTELEDRLEVSDAENQILTETITNLKAEYDAGGYVEEPEAEVLYDPYYSRNPYQIVGEIAPDANYPEGQVLGWKNEKHREQRRGWRGWIPLEYGDKYAGKEGKLLQNYIIDPPPRMAGSAAMDNNVRRTDSVLCRLDKRIFDTRQSRRETLGKRNISEAGSSRTKVLREGVEVTGSGLKDQDRPAGGFKQHEVAVVGEHHQKFNIRKPQED